MRLPSFILLSLITAGVLITPIWASALLWLLYRLGVYLGRLSLG